MTHRAVSRTLSQMFPLLVETLSYLIVVILLVQADSSLSSNFFSSIYIKPFFLRYSPISLATDNVSTTGVNSNVQVLLEVTLKILAIFKKRSWKSLYGELFFRAVPDSLNLECIWF